MNTGLTAPPAARAEVVWLGRGYQTGTSAFFARCMGRREVCHRRWRMSPTVFREGPFRFFFFSREEERVHIHVQSPDGEAKFWIEPQVELARNHRLSEQDLRRVLQL